MFLREYRDIVGGSILALIGLVFAGYALQNYDLGVPTDMGPGMFPVALGVLLAALGAAIVFVGFIQREAFPEIRVRVPFFVLSGLIAFGLLLAPFGLLPAVLGTVIVASFAEVKVRPASLAALSAALCLIAWVIFGIGLKLPVAMIRWPF